MAFFVQPFDKIDINTETFTIIREKEKRNQLRALGKAEQRETFRIWIYDNAYFNYFYAKHCLGEEGRGDFTLLVDENGGRLSVTNVRNIIEKALREINNIKMRTNLQPLKKKKLRILKYHREAGETSRLQEGTLIFDGITEVTPKDLSRLKQQGSITARELAEIKTLLENSKRPGYGYVVTSLVFVQHIEVR